MPLPRLFVNHALAEDKTLTLPVEAMHYLAHVRRLREGDGLLVFNGEGGEYQAEVLQLKKGMLSLKIKNYQAVSNESPLQLELAQGVARGEKMDLIIQKAVELGIKKIIPLFTERSTIKLTADKREKRREHWQAIAISACEQSGRAFVPPVVLPLSLADWLKGFQGQGFTLAPASTKHISSLTIPENRALTLLVGPEGGLSQAEVRLAEQKEFLPLNLGPRILRTETAALVAITALQTRFGDLA
ncbi:MAG TPA: 16S rRNA (uracil(1498)-N(3))-methyltransferase [Gammaproteobacteria bacterium]|nr:16S rRNA (uracil(1498)-N(3))-methyltransferase [Gammaproteobacteria bacterium]